MSARIEVIGGPWRERIGCRGWIVDDPGDSVYPFTSRRQADEVVIALDHDPLNADTFLSNGQRWTCVVRLSSIKQIGGTVNEPRST